MLTVWWRTNVCWLDRWNSKIAIIVEYVIGSLTRPIADWQMTLDTTEKSILLDCFINLVF
jgi:hypothetical protein